MLQPLRPYTSIRSVVVALALLCLGTWITFRTYSHSESAARGSARDARTSRASNSNPAKPDEATRTRVSDAYGKLPLSFEINRGQMSDRVKFLSRGSGYSLFLTSADAVMVLRKTDSAKTSNPQTVIGNQKSALLRMKLIGANRSTLVEGREELPGKSNYFIGNDPTKWQTNVPNYQKVRYSNVYPGIDLVYHGNQRQLEYDFVVAPGANPGLIKLNFHGARRINVDRNGDLVLRTANGEIRQLKPIVYQVVNGERQSINGHYVVRQGNHVAFKIGKYNTSEPLLIDPTLVYSTYLGGSGNDYG